MEKNCLICDSPTINFATMQVRAKHDCELRRCTRCGFLFAANPNWLAEAYADPINRSDVGYVNRNLICRDKVSKLIEASGLNHQGKFLDYAAGYGMFVRLMRDSGYDFRWDDLYCKNLFSLGFEANTPLAGPFEAVTAFEVMEHLTDPAGELKKISALTDVFIFSTTLVAEPPPQPQEWWYYGLEHGQHVAFYTRKSLEVLGEKFGYHLTTNGDDFHVLARRPIIFEVPYIPKPARWNLLAQRRWKEPVRRASLLESDFKQVVDQINGERRKQ